MSNHCLNTPVCTCTKCAAERNDSSHLWWTWSGLECCKLCGIVRRRDGRNGPCKGVVKVELRTLPAGTGPTRADRRKSKRK